MFYLIAPSQGKAWLSNLLWVPNRSTCTILRFHHYLTGQWFAAFVAILTLPVVTSVMLKPLFLVVLGMGAWALLPARKVYLPKQPLPENRSINPLCNSICDCLTYFFVCFFVVTGIKIIWHISFAFARSKIIWYVWFLFVHTSSYGIACSSLFVWQFWLSATYLDCESNILLIV